MKGSHPLIEPLPADERLSEEDMAARREAEFLADALAAQALRAAGGAVVQRGVCAECGAACLPAAVYCDPGCKAEHEKRLAIMARQQRRPGR